VDHTDSTVATNAQPDKDCASGEILFNEVRGAIKRINPYACIFSVKCFKVFRLNLVGSVSITKALVDKVTSLLVRVVKLLSRDKVLDCLSDLLGVNSGLLLFDGLGRLLTFDS
jgi:hypothetical protein